MPLGAVATPAAPQGLCFQTARSPDRTDLIAHTEGGQVHLAEVVGMTDADLGIPAQVAEQGLACDVAQRVAGHGGGGTNRTSMIIRRVHGHWIPYVHTPWWYNDAFMALKQLYRGVGKGNGGGSRRHGNEPLRTEGTA